MNRGTGFDQLLLNAALCFTLCEPEDYGILAAKMRPVSPIAAK